MNSKSKYARKKRPMIWAVPFLSFWFIALILIPLGGQPRGPRQPILDMKVELIKLDQVGMGEALRQLRSKNKEQILIGFEEISHAEGQQQKPISMELSGLTVGAILNKLVAADPRYTYEVTAGSVINVFPRGAKNDPTNLLNIRVSKFALHGKFLPQDVIRRMGEYAPELRNYLTKKAREHAAQTKIYPGGAGSILSGGMEPQIDLEMQNVTVREILNAIALYSVKLFHERPNWFPIGWKYEFIIDPGAQTGLGGYPKWSEF